MMNVEKKYNGRWVDSIDKIKAIARHVAETRQEGDGLVIVASAMGRTTDRLIKMAQEVSSDIPKRELDALLATVQMPSGIPVATVALNGAKNAAWLAAEILALGDEALAAKLDAERVAMARQIAAKEEKLQKEIEEL